MTLDQLYKMSDAAAQYYTTEALRALQRGDWRGAMHMLQRAELCHNGSGAIGHGIARVDDAASAEARERALAKLRAYKGD